MSAREKTEQPWTASEAEIEQRRVGFSKVLLQDFGRLILRMPGPAPGAAAGRGQDYGPRQMACQQAFGKFVACAESRRGRPEAAPSLRSCVKSQACFVITCIWLPRYLPKITSALGGDWMSMKLLTTRSVLPSRLRSNAVRLIAPAPDA